jgi:thiamine transport system substrate-binding protein
LIRELGETGLRGSLEDSDRKNLIWVMPAQGDSTAIGSRYEELRTMRKLTTALIGLALIAAACGDDAAETPEVLTLMAHDSFADAVTAETFQAFTDDTGIAVNVLAAGDAGGMVTQAVLAAGNPVADVMFGVDDTFLSRALDADVFTSHTSELIGSVPDSLKVGPEDRVTPISYGDVCLNYDKEWFETAQLDVPTELDDLRDEDYAQALVVEHPATSSPGLAFVLATIDEFGEDGWLDYWRDLKDAGVKVAPDWTTAYYGDFTIYGGDRSLVVSYASSPPAEVIFAEEPLDEAPTGVIEAGCYRQVEFAGVLDGTEYPEAAGDLIDFMLSVEFQETVPLNWFVFPANTEAGLPQEFIDHTVLPESPTQLDPAYIAENRETWIQQWADLMDS